MKIKSPIVGVVLSLSLFTLCSNARADESPGDELGSPNSQIQKMIVNVLDSGADASGGFSKVVNGIGGAVGAYRYTFDANKRFRVQGGTNLAYGIGNAIAVEEVVRGQIQLERKHAKDEQKHELLTQIMDDEIAQIEDAQRLLLATD